mmetsp:Transcript_1225/g.3907  ORF Transcript_1225/g.3907 Transcript_1225/m.3907 type:complete len:319 (+) Transcript_1225:491-1447(+)
MDDARVAEPPRRHVELQLRADLGVHLRRRRAERRVERLVGRVALAELGQVVRAQVDLRLGQERGRVALGGVQPPQRREEQPESAGREAARRDEVRKGDAAHALQRHRGDVTRRARRGGHHEARRLGAHPHERRRLRGQGAAAARRRNGVGAVAVSLARGGGRGLGDLYVWRRAQDGRRPVARRRVGSPLLVLVVRRGEEAGEEVGDVGRHAAVEEHLATQHRGGGRLDDEVARDLHLVEVARRNHPLGQAALLPAQPPANVLLGVDGGARHSAIHIQVGVRLPKVDLVVRDVELRHRLERHVAARRDDGADVAVQVEH